MHKQRIIENLSHLIQIPSVSADPEKKGEMKGAVELLKSKLEEIGFTCELLKKGENPALLYARYHVPDATHTIGIYGHYDVQPEDPREEWTVEPFELTRNNGKLWGRGVADNKGHIVQNIEAVRSLIKSQSLKSNIVFIVEGEEECGSEAFETYLLQKKEELNDVDVFFITDVGMHAKNVPQIIYALRGLAYFEIEVEIGSRDLHSGVYGNAVLNPAQLLADLFSHMKDVKSGEILIPGFYDDVRAPAALELELLNKGAVPAAEYLQETGTQVVTSFRGQPAYLAPKLFPSLDIHGFESGFTGEGPKTVIPRRARAKFSCRLVADQTVQKTEDVIRSFIKAYMPHGARYDLKTYSYDDPFFMSIEDEYVKRVSDVLSEHFGHETVLMREGGSVPAAEIIQRLFGTSVILTGFILPDSNLHSPDENFDEEMFLSGIEALKKVFSSIS